MLCPSRSRRPPKQLTGDPDDPGQALSVNRYALENSTWLDGSQTGAETSMSDPPARELERFVNQ